MRRAYVVVGERQEEPMPEVWYAIAHSMSRADELCYEAEKADPEHAYVWYEVIEEEDD